MSTYIDICPGANPASPSDRTAKRIGWISSNPDNPSETGMYLKGPLAIGGTSTSNAPIKADSSGNVTINGTLRIGTSGMWLDNGAGSYTIIHGGVVTVTDSNGTSAVDITGNVAGGITLYNGRGIYATGVVRADQGFNYNGYAGATGTFTSADGKTVTVRGGIITSIA